MVIGRRIALRLLAMLMLVFLASLAAPDAAQAHESADATITVQASDAAPGDVDTDCPGGIACHAGGVILSISSASPSCETTDRILTDGIDLSGISPTRDPPVPIS